MIKPINLDVFKKPKIPTPKKEKKADQIQEETDKGGSKSKSEEESIESEDGDKSPTVSELKREMEEKKKQRE